MGLICGIGAMDTGRLCYVSSSPGTRSLLLSRSRDIGDDNESMKPVTDYDATPDLVLGLQGLGHRAQ